MKITETRTVGGVTITRTIEYENEKHIEAYSSMREWILELVGVPWPIKEAK